MTTFGGTTFGGEPVRVATPSLRFRQRHVHETCLHYIRTALDDLGWRTPPINFGTRPVTLLEYQPEEAGAQVVPNTVAVTMGDEPEDVDEELGAGLQSCDYTLFVDVYGANAPVASSIASDLKAALKNRLIPMRDYSTEDAGVATQHTIEFNTVMIDRPTPTGGVDKRYWRVVKATATLYFIED
jgi:hypothetical protein